MAHHIMTNRDGSHAYIGRQSAWHALGTVTGKYQTTAELLADETFKFDLFKSQLHDGLGRTVDAWGIFRWDRADRAAGRKDATQFVAPVGRDYTVIPFSEGFKTIDTLMQSADGSHYETAGVLDYGARLWALADLNLSMHIGDDEHKAYVLFTTSYDGSMSHQYKLVDERVVCHNTLTMAIGENSYSFKVKATKNAQDRLIEGRRALETVGQSVRGMEERLKFLATRKMTRESATAVFDRLFPRAKNDDGTERETTRRSNIIAEILGIYESNDGNAFPEQRGTSYNLLNAVTNYVDHERMRDSKGTARYESAALGSGASIKANALDLIVAESEKLPAMPQRVVIGSFADIGLNVPAAEPALVG